MREEQDSGSGSAVESANELDDVQDEIRLCTEKLEKVQGADL